MTQQHPISSGFGARSTARDVVGGLDLSGKVAIVTGGHAGIGLETTRALLEAGATVVVPARDAGRAAAALEGMPRVEQATLDLMDPASIDAFARGFLASGRPLHLLINNAGIMATPLTRDARGYESQFATNHLGHFQLTARLWPALAAARGARVVSVSSLAHRGGPVSLDDPSFEHEPYDRGKAYSRSKTANVLFAVGLDRRGAPAGVRAFSAHPGVIFTGLYAHVTPEQLRAIRFVDEHDRPADFVKTAEQGGATSTWCAVSPRLGQMGGVYCEDCDVAEAVPADSQKFGGVRPWAIDPVAADQLWELSERMTGVQFRP